MSIIKKKDNSVQGNSGLALALLLGESFIFYRELLGFCEYNSASVGKRKLRRSFPVKKHVLRVANKRVVREFGHV